MTPAEQSRARILRRLDGPPHWARSFQAVKRQLANLIDEGLVERVAPPGGRARNMVRLTEAGQAALAELAR